MPSVCFRRPLEFEDGTPITRARPTAGNLWRVYADRLPEPWDSTCITPSEGVTVQLDGNVLGFRGRCAKVRNVAET